MKTFFGFILLIAVMANAVAADVVSKLTIKHGDKVLAVSINELKDLSADEVKDARLRGQRVLDYGSNHQDKGGSYTMVFEWSVDGKDEPAIELQGMKHSAVKNVARKGTDWLNGNIDKSKDKDKK